MFTATRECPNCGGTGFRPLFGPLYIQCRRCRGTGQMVKLSARLIHRLRFGAGEDY